jgi:hypothetical protein
MADENVMNETFIIYQRPVQRSWMDVHESFVRRIASIFQTIPKWIYVPTDDKLISTDTIVLVKQIQDMLKKRLSYLDFMNWFSSKKQYFSSDTIHDELMMYWFDQKRKKDTIGQSFAKIQFIEELKEALKKFPNHLNTEQKIDFFIERTIYEDYRDREHQLMESVRLNKLDSDTFDSTMQRLDVMEGVPYQPFQKKEMFITITCETSFTSIETLFAQFTCSPMTVVALYSSVYKQYDQIMIPERWKMPDFYELFIDQHSMVAMIYHKINEKHGNVVDKDEYTMCRITCLDGVLKIIYVHTTSVLATADLILDRFVSSVNDMKKPKYTIQEDEIQGNYIIPCKAFDTIIMSDMIMNDPMFSSFMCIDESRNMFKIKGGLTIRMFIKNKEIKCTLTSSQRYQHTDDYRYVRNIPLYVLPEKGHFIRLYIKHSEQMDILPFVINLFSKLISYYVENQHSIYNLYRSYQCKTVIIKEPCDIPNITDIKLTKVHANNYTRHCERERLPRVVNLYPSEFVRNDHTMTFPSNESVVIPITDDTPAHTYTCKDNTHKNIGLQINTLENRDSYPYVPCCFTTKQDVKDTGLRKYLDGMYPEDIEKAKQQNIRIKKPFIGTNEDDLGILPENLTRLLQSVEKRKTHFYRQYKYLRQGVHETPYSLLECVMTSISDKKPSKDEIHAMYERLKQPREQFALVSQEHPGETVENIYESYCSMTYMDPRKWTRLLEKVFECKIVCFSRKGDEDDALITFPHHQMSYLQYHHPYPNKQTIVCVYEHYGVDFSRRSYPKCELVVCVNQKNTKVKLRHLFGGDTHLIQYQQEAIQQYDYRLSLRSMTLIDAVRLPFSEKDILSQWIDSYGKTRAIILAEGDVKITVLTTPLPPLDKPLMKENEIYHAHQLTVDILDAFIKKYKLRPYSIHKAYVSEFTFVFGDSYYTIKVNNKTPTDIMDDVKQVDEQYPSSDPVNKLTRYFTEKRLATIATEYFIYFYSHFMKDRPRTKKIDTEFIKNLAIDPNVTYDIPTRPEISLSILNKHRFTNNQMFLISNEETQKRLLYGLQHRITTKYDDVYTYFEKKEMSNFYSDHYHYASISGQQKNTIVVSNLQSVDTIDHAIHDHILPEQQSAFLQNPLIEQDNICLLRLNKPSHTDADPSYTYVYNSKHDIIPLKSDHETQIVFYKNKKMTYMAVIPLLDR